MKTLLILLIVFLASTSLDQGAELSGKAASHRLVVVDQDADGPGGSNLQALLLLLQAPDVEVLGITVESGDGWRDENAAHALRMLELIGRTDVPVVPGAIWPLVNTPEFTKRWEARFGKLAYKGAWTESWPTNLTEKRPPYHPPHVIPPLPEGTPSTKPLSENAANFLVRTVRAHPGEVTIVALGPLTNLALAARLDDEFASLVKELVVMGGSFNPVPTDSEFAREYLHTPRSEFNFRWDPEAAKIVLHSRWPSVTLVPLDPCARTLLTPELARQAAASDTPAARYLGQYARPLPLWDELAVALWLEPSLATRRQQLAVDVDTDSGAGYGNTLSWPAGEGPGLGERSVDVVLDVDLERFNAFFVESFRPAAAGRSPASVSASIGSAANPADVDSISNIVRVSYEVINGPAGVPRQWDRDRTLYMPGTTFVSLNEANGKVTATMLTPEEYRRGFRIDRASYETEVGRVIERYGNVAQVRSVAVVRRSPDGAIEERYVNYFQLYYDGARWWIAGMVWDKERPSTPIPATWIGQWQDTSAKSPPQTQ